MTKMIFGEEGFQYIQYCEKEFCIDSSLCSIMFLIYVQYHLIIWGSDKKDKRRKTCSPFSKCVAAPPLAVTFYVSSIWLLDFGTSNFQHIEIKGFSVLLCYFLLISGISSHNFVRFCIFWLALWPLLICLTFFATSCT